MPDEPGGYELQRSIEALRSDVHQLVPMGVHASELRRVDQRIDDVVKDVAELERKREADHQVARQAKQWAVGVAITSLGAVIAIITLVGRLP